MFLISGGRLGDRIGRRRAFALGLALFTLSSAACGLAPTPTALVAARLVQGIAGALLMPNVMAIIGVAYTGPDRVRALSVYGAVMGLAAAGGQVIGGLLVQADIAGLGWRTCFLVNVPVGARSRWRSPRGSSPSRKPAGSPRTDLTGTALITVGLTAIVLPLVDGRQHGWPAWTWVSLGARTGDPRRVRRPPAAAVTRSAAPRCSTRGCSRSGRSPPG